MSSRPSSICLLLVLAGLPALAQPDARVVAQQSAERSYRIISAVHASAGGQDDGLRRCRSYMADAASSEKLGAKEMTARNWDRAARGCKADAIMACRTLKSAAPEHCEGMPKLGP